MNATVALATRRTSRDDSIVTWLMQNGYSSDEALVLAQRLLPYPDLYGALQHLASGGRPEMVDVESGDVSLRFLLQQHSWMTPPNALAFLAWVRSDPARALSALRAGLKIR